MKDVKFKGNIYSVPDWAAYISCDQSGLIYVFETQPRYENPHWVQDGVYWRVSYVGKVEISECKAVTI